MIISNLYNVDSIIMLIDLIVALSASITFTYITCRFIQDTLKEYFELCRQIDTIKIQLEPRDFELEGLRY